MSEMDVDLGMDGAGLYREELFTDRRVGTIRQLVPVKSDGSADPARATLFVGQAQIVTQAGMLPITFDIEATSLDQAVRAFAAAAKLAIEDTVRELQELRRQAASQLVIPDPGTASSILGPGGLPPGGGKIRMP